MHNFFYQTYYEKNLKETLAHMPPSRTLVRAVAAKRNFGCINPNFASKNDINFENYDVSFGTTRTIIQYDSGAEDLHRLIIVSNDELIEFARASTSFAMDGTFSIAPKCYNNGTTNRCGQLYSIHAIKDDIQIPVAYALMARRTESEYNRLFAKLDEIFDGFTVQKLIIDMERAARNAAALSFPHAAISYCYYHFQVILLLFKIKKIYKIA